MIIGVVGSRKSSIGVALIGDIDKQGGSNHVDGTIAYCPQTAWINNSTVSGNITFGSTFQEDKYKKVVRVCGQRARIQLAKAVYSDRDIYILDDPLSAVDAHVGRFLLEECIDGELKGKTRLLMTNQLQFIVRADNIILLSKGLIAAQGTSKQLKEQGINFDEFIIKSTNKDKKSKHHHLHHHNDKQEETKKEERMEQKEEFNDNKDNKQNKAAKQIMTEEEQETESVSWGSYFYYILSLCPWQIVIPYFLLIAIPEVIQVYQSWWMGIVGDPLRYSQISYHWKV
ncbi:MAG: putative ABC transporter [Streblomastix strix]|uniref:Putative ABC transporter n=1 Tax=Streblomastix strix TaxID=222440 RepID=A0A5J4X1M2_9EUKA|nr:MAG: putative ABC transporter [Streblomastix strix]